MSDSSIDTLVKMANQIGQFFSAQKSGDEIAEAADHLKRFWGPGMRTRIVDYVARGGNGLNPTALAAVRRIAPEDVIAKQVHSHVA
jgi:formate dehydrogenase subunit delta